MLSKKIIKDSQVNIETVLNLLEKGELIALPTETVYALSCDPKNINAVNKIYEIKKRDKEKPLALLCSSVSMIEEFAELSPIEKKILEKFSPGPLSLVVRLKSNHSFAKNFNAGKDTVAVRIPDNDFLLKLINKPIIGTSINNSGEPPLQDPEVIEETYKDMISIVVTTGEKSSGLASTVAEVVNNKIKIIRAGYIKKEELEEFIEQNS